MTLKLLRQTVRLIMVAPPTATIAPIKMPTMTTVTTTTMADEDDCTYFSTTATATATTTIATATTTSSTYPDSSLETHNCCPWGCSHTAPLKKTKRVRPNLCGSSKTEKRKEGCSCRPVSLPKGPKVVPFWDYLIEFYL